MVITPHLAVRALSVASPLLLAGVVGAQGFGGDQVISTALDGAFSVHATDLDGDGDQDVLSASVEDDKIAWYENLGAGVFGPQQVITTSAHFANEVYAADLDGDGDADVLSASYWDSKLAWYENLGGGAFGGQQVITMPNTVAGVKSVYAADLDEDGDTDVLLASFADDKVAWYENLGGGAFGPIQLISSVALGAESVYATDLDGDGDQDVLSASFRDDKIAWYENDGAGGFGPPQVITTAADGAWSVFATDLDGDGDQDVLSASANDDKIAWYENLGSGVFGAQQVISTAMIAAVSVHATDLDGDGDQDVLSASILDDKIAWYENLGSGAFGAQQVITVAADAPYFVYAADLDGDGDQDALSASYLDDKIAWYENLMPHDCNSDGLHDLVQIQNNPALDMNGDGLLDECVPASYCTGGINSSGAGGSIMALGSPQLALNNLTLHASGLPTQQWSYFLMSQNQANVPNFGGSQGVLCLGAPIVRFVMSGTGQVGQTTPGGTRTYTVDFLNLPSGVVFMPGETWNFQLWYRDLNPGATSNTSDGVTVMFR